DIAGGEVLNWTPNPSTSTRFTRSSRWSGWRRSCARAWPKPAPSRRRTNRRIPQNPKGTDPMRVTKIHDIGNDSVYVDCIRNPPPRHPAELSVKVSDRHFGIGSDGLILICPSERADVRMRMFNADGSESEMCGNGVRCVAKFAFDHGLTKNNPMKV